MIKVVQRQTSWTFFCRIKDNHQITKRPDFYQCSSGYFHFDFTPRHVCFIALEYFKSRSRKSLWEPLILYTVSHLWQLINYTFIRNIWSLRFKWASALSELALDKDLYRRFAGMLVLTQLWCLFADQRTWKEQKKSLAWWYFYQGYLTAALWAHCGTLLRFVTEDADKKRQIFPFSQIQFGVAWVFSAVSLHGRRREKRITVAARRKLGLNFSAV